MSLIWPAMPLIVHIGLIVWMVGLLLLRDSGTSDARLAWIVFIVLAPFVGALAYLFLGGPRIAGRRRRLHARVHMECTIGRCATPSTLLRSQASIPAPYDRVFALAGAVSEFDVSGGNELHLCRTPEDFVDEFEHDLDHATETIHVLTYIYLDDEVGQRLGHAMIRAVQRGVTVRLQVDSVGSKDFLKSTLRVDIAGAGVQLVELLPAKIVRALFSRIDLRNHRKIAVIDNTIGWMGSRNIASPDFAPKARYAPWVDCMASVRGQAVHDLQAIFLEDWQVATGEPHPELLHVVQEPFENGACCQIVGTGPNFNNDALTNILQACFHSAQEELMLTTPYYVPDAATEAALLTTAMRGVRTTLIVPARNDSRLVALASRSHYAKLIRAGVEIQEFQAGLLHAKAMTVDHSLFMIGSANLDRRSLELNLEVSMFGWCPNFASQLHFLQKSYLNDSEPVDTAKWLNQGAPTRMVHNLAGLLSPLL